MSKKIKIDDLSKEISNIMKDYVDATEECVEKAVTKTAKEALRELKGANPPGSGKYGSWSEYNKSWKITQTKTDKRYHKKATIHNVKYYRLTHLLEKGHAMVGGGRTREFPHIKPIADISELSLMENIKKGI